MEGGVNPNDVHTDNSVIYIVMGSFFAIFVAWLKKADPRLIIKWINAPTMEPFNDELRAIRSEMRSGLSKIHSVIDHMPGAKEAHEAVEAEKKRWGT